MTRTVTIIALAAAAALAGCSNTNQDAAAEGAEEANQAAAPVELPPSITASKIYRCKDNSLVYIDWLSDGTARVKQSREDVGTVLPAEEVAKLGGDAKAPTITYNNQSCRA